MSRADGRVVIGVDLGGGSIRTAAITVSGQIVSSVRMPTDTHHGVNAVLDRIAHSIQQVVRDADLPHDTVVGIGAPGPLDPYLGIVLIAPNLPGWINIPLRDALHQRSGHPVVIANDANAAVLGERWFGAGIGCDNLIYIGIGTGLGSGVVANGHLIDGYRGLGVELGHMTIDLNGPVCSCGGRGCLEAFCSNWALERDAGALISSGRGRGLVVAAGSSRIDARAISVAALAGDAEAIEILQSAGRALGAGLANCVNIFSPERIAIGGGVAGAAELLLDPARESLQQRAMPAMLAHCEVVLSALGDHTGVLGAAGVALQHLDAGLMHP